MNCIRCTAELDRHEGVNTGDKPKDGDFTVCGYCSELMVFDDGELIAPTEADLDELPAGILLNLQKAQEIAGEFREKCNKSR